VEDGPESFFFFVIQQERTRINGEQKETLETFFKDGMTRVGSELIPRAASATGLDTSVIEIVVWSSCTVPSVPRVCFPWSCFHRVLVPGLCSTFGFFTSPLPDFSMITIHLDFSTIITVSPRLIEVPVSPLSCCLCVYVYLTLV
ncbi:hypothetical protein DPX16_19777, partial [Anabarilius grahami]